MNKQNIAYDKAIMIINSCRTFNQLKNAKQYVNLFKLKFNDFDAYLNLLGVLTDKDLKLNYKNNK